MYYLIKYNNQKLEVLWEQLKSPITFKEIIDYYTTQLEGDNTPIENQVAIPQKSNSEENEINKAKDQTNCNSNLVLPPPIKHLPIVDLD